MSEVHALATSYAGTGHRPLGLHAAALAERLADVIDGLGSQDPLAGSTISFLRDWAADASNEAQVADATLSSPRRLDLLVDRFGLTPDERDLVVLAGLAEAHEGLAGTFRSLHALGEPRPTVGLACLVLGDAGRDEVRRLLGEGAAVRGGILVVEGSAALPERSLRLADRLWEVLHGVDARPDGLRVVDLEAALPGLEEWLAEEAVTVAATAVRDREPVTILLTGEDQVVAVGRAAALLGSVGAGGFAVCPTAADGRLTGEEMVAAAVHAAPRDRVPVLLIGDADPGRGPVDLAPLTGLDGPVVVVAPPGCVRPQGRRALLGLTVGPVSPRATRSAWRALLPGVDEATADAIASRTPMDPAWVVGIAGDVAATGQDPTPQTVASAARRRTGSALPAGAALSRPHVGWERLVLPAAPREQLQEAVARLDHQGTVLEEWDMTTSAFGCRGVRLLLTGAPGTGKTLAAQVLATAARTDLLRIDLSQVVSKWLGETEKNLAAAFAAAERTQAVLLFDEADALFASRTEVSDAHDRYANLETAYLLQRVENFHGLAVLTTNLRRNVDEALVRRMDFVVDFPTPDEAARLELWRLHLPAGHVAPDVSTEVLARMYPVPGAWIRNAALAAAYVAASRSEDVHQHHLTAAVRREYGKASLPYPGDPPRRTR